VGRRRDARRRRGARRDAAHPRSLPDPARSLGRIALTSVRTSARHSRPLPRATRRIGRGSSVTVGTMNRALCLSVSFLATTLAGASSAYADDPDDPFTGFVAASVSATSKLDAKHDAASAFDGTDGWCAKKGDGVGETLTLTFALPYTAQELDV